jgi:NAD(P)-dependent dehydrogenase (short-subunit alcohol dehydrogenase family)
VAVVAGGSRGAGRGIALALGEAGATVYVVGRTRRDGPRPRDGAPGTIDDTAEDVTRRGGLGIAAAADLTNASDVERVFDRVRTDHHRLDILANAVWGGSDAYDDPEKMLSSWGMPFWKQSPDLWQHMMMAGPYAYYCASLHAARLMSENGGGLIAGVTDGIMAPAGEPAPSPSSSSEYHGGGVLWDLAHATINRLLYTMSVEAKKQKIAVLALMPGFMRTERVQRHMQTEKQRKQFGYDHSETPEYLGRAVAALAADRHVLKKTGRIHFVADLASEYGFTDTDGKQVPRFNPFA